MQKSVTEDAGQKPLSARKRRVLEHADAIAGERDGWIEKNSAYYAEDRDYMRFLVPAGARVLDLGCGTGDLLAGLSPSQGVGIDLSPKMVEIARRKYPDLDFRVGDIEDGDFIGSLGGPFDYIILSDTIGQLEDIETALAQLHPLCTRETRFVIAYYSHLWEPVLRLGEALKLRMPQTEVNFISNTDFHNILDLADFEPIRQEQRQLVPRRLLGLGRLINRYIAPLPLVRRLCLRTYIVARSKAKNTPQDNLSATVLVPCRNERGNIETAIRRMPRFSGRQQIVFVEGNSSDGTYEECLRVKEAYRGEWDIEVYKQTGKGKGDAVRLGFDMAKGDVLMILDADLTMPPEALPKFYAALASGKGEFINGTRLIYPLEDEAMRTLNFVANHFFARVFSYLINQRFTDTLCGTKVLKKSDYMKIAANRDYFGEFDPFGDFDLIFGAAKQNLKIIEIPIHYAARQYGETQISRFSDGLLLLRMVLFAFKKLKAV
ncbi:MAG: glycosyltransferase [Hyphomicrobiales bacterium]